MRLSGENTHRTRALSVVAVLVFVALLGFGWYAFVRSHTQFVANTPAPTAQQAPIVPTAVSSTVLFTGNTYWAAMLIRQQWQAS